MVTTDIILQLFGISAAHGFDTKAQGVNEVAMVRDIVAPVGYAAHIDGLAMSLEEDVKRAFEVLVESPVTSKIIARAAWHKSKLYLSALLRGEFSTHNTIDYFAECAITAQYENLGTTFLLHEFARQLYGVISIFGHAIDERLSTLLQQFPQI